jgi:hypothetical protein
MVGQQGTIIFLFTNIFKTSPSSAKFITANLFHTIEVKIYPDFDVMVV